MFKILFLIFFAIFYISCSNLDINKIQCDNSKDCPKDAVCNNGSCILKNNLDECNTNEDCTDITKPICDSGKCVATIVKECDSDNNCANNETCIRNICISKCQNSTNPNGCNVTKHEICAQDAKQDWVCMCEAGYHPNRPSGECIIDECTKNEDCTAPGKTICDNGVCIADTTDSCNGVICGVGGYCVSLNSNDYNCECYSGYENRNGNRDSPCVKPCIDKSDCNTEDGNYCIQVETNKKICSICQVGYHENPDMGGPPCVPNTDRCASWNTGKSRCSTDGDRLDTCNGSNWVTSNCSSCSIRDDGYGQCEQEQQTCNSNSDCTDTYLSKCNTITHECMPNELTQCNNKADCGASHFLCIEHVCQCEYGYNNFDNPSFCIPEQNCDTQNLATRCSNDYKKIEKCDNRQWITDTDCALDNSLCVINNDNVTTICQPNQQTCNSNNDCPSDQVCNPNNFCEPNQPMGCPPHSYDDSTGLGCQCVAGYKPSSGTYPLKDSNPCIIDNDSPCTDGDKRCTENYNEVQKCTAGHWETDTTCDLSNDEICDDHDINSTNIYCISPCNGGLPECSDTGGVCHVSTTGGDGYSTVPECFCSNATNGNTVNDGPRCKSPSSTTCNNNGNCGDPSYATCREYDNSYMCICKAGYHRENFNDLSSPCVADTTIECTKDTDCGNYVDKPVCDTGSHTCVPCQSNNDCLRFDGTKTCDNGTCVECTETDLSSCSITNARCFNHTCIPCSDNNDCSRFTETPICNSGTCIANIDNCTVDEDCQYNTNYKTSCKSNHCDYECHTSDDCDNIQKSKCDTSSNQYICIPCSEDNDCSNFDDTPICNDGTCVECKNDANCQENSNYGNNYECGSQNTCILIATKWKTMSIGLEHTCAIDENDNLYCWGANNKGQLGIGSNTDSYLTPQQVNGSWKTVSCGVNHTCAIDSNNKLWCWGSDSRGQLGTGNTGGTNIPKKVTSPADWKYVSTGNQFTCGITTDNKPYCWGLNENYQVGFHETGVDQYYVPQNLSSKIPNAKQIKSNDIYTCAVDDSSKVFCWGWNVNQIMDTTSGYGGIGVTELKDSASQDIIAINNYSISRSYGCILKSSNIYCWGNNLYGNLGRNDTTNISRVDFSKPVIDNVSSTMQFKALDSGYYYSCGINDDNQLYCWGKYNFNDNNNYLIATKIPNVAAKKVFINRFKRVDSSNGNALMETHACYIDLDDRLYCRGANDKGQLGINNNTRQDDFTLVNISN